MRFEPLPIAGAYRITAEPIDDERGSFARTWCAQEAESHGLNPRVVQCSRSFNRRRGTLRGMHFQSGDHAECKWVKCSQGAIFDVLIDLRRASTTYCQWHGVELVAERLQTLYLPPGIAHGFLTLVDEAVVEYQMSEFFAPQAASGVRWNDPCFAIEWPMATPEVISSRDANYPDYIR